ncbi:hypothetical protein CDAR_453361, partial [Caerostris darwini]
MFSDKLILLFYLKRNTTRNKNMDLESDQELEALRKAALASMKFRLTDKKKSEVSPIDAISKVSAAVKIKDMEQSTYRKHDSKEHAHGDQHSRNNSRSLRRGRGRQFPKPNPRSNLIVITPVGDDDKKPNGKENVSVSSLMLPQRKWGSSVNEESSSPKENRPIGPTRFNRHGSSSDSDSNSESESDRSDSYSNDTVLQDEPSRNFSGLTPEENTEDEPIAAQKKSDHRLNFENIDSNLPNNFLQRKSDNFHDVEKNVCSNSSKNERKSGITVSRNNVTELKKEYANDQYNSASVSNEHSVRTKDNSPVHSKNAQSILLIANGGFHSRKDDFSRKSISLENKYSRKNCDYPLDNKSGDFLAKKDTRNQLNNLSEDDLRINLQKSGRELKSNKTYSSQIQNESSHLHTVEQSRNHIHQRQSEKVKHHDNHSLHKSRERRFHGGDKSRSSNSSPEDHAQSTSPFQQNSQQTNFRVDQHPKRKHTNSSDRSYKRSCSRSPTQQSAVYNLSHRQYSGSSSSSSSSSSGSNQQIRSISSVVRTVDSKVNGIGSVDKHPVPSSKSNYVATSKRERHSDEKPKLVSSAVQSSTFGGSRNNATGGNKRVPVHMRLGSFPLKRVIQMPKDVEAAFVNSSSDEDDKWRHIQGKGKKIQSRAIAVQQVLHFPLTIFSTGNSDIYYALFTL